VRHPQKGCSLGAENSVGMNATKTTLATSIGRERAFVDLYTLQRGPATDQPNPQHRRCVPIGKEAGNWQRLAAPGPLLPLFPGCKLLAFLARLHLPPAPGTKLPKITPHPNPTRLSSFSSSTQHITSCHPPRHTSTRVRPNLLLLLLPPFKPRLSTHNPF
jgi:hypothetical protein